MTASGTLVVGDGGSQIRMPIILSISLLAGQTPNLVVSGSANQPYVLQATANLASPAWTPITTNTTDATGLFSFADLNATSFSSQFYRAALP
jgi:hypothetical protein